MLKAKKLGHEDNAMYGELLIYNNLKRRGLYKYMTVPHNDHTVALYAAVIYAV